MNGWRLEFEGFEPDQEGLREALCTLGNGYFATRGAASEARADGVHYPGTYLAGGYSRLVTKLEGRAIENEDLVNFPNWLTLTFRRPGEGWFDLGAVEILEYQQDLDLLRGVLTRRVRFRDGWGGVTGWTQRRFVSMREPHIAGLESTFVAENWSGALEVRSALDGRVQNTGVPRYRRLRGDHLLPLSTTAIDEETVGLEVETRGSHLRVAQAARTRVSRDGAPVAARRSLVQEPAFIGHDLVVELEEGVPVTVEKVIALFSSRDHAISAPAHEASSWVRRTGSFEQLLEGHVLAWDHMWRRFDIQIEGSEWAQRLLRLHIFHLVQTASERSIDLDVGIPARGLHGEAYRGHVFWDELFIFPLLNLRLPVLTRTLLGYRFRRLPEARWAAREAGYRGAMYPWQSGSDGREETQVIHLNPRSGRWLPDNSRLQRHVGIAVAYNAWQHYQVTADLEFLRFRGGVMIIEIARFLASLATFNEGRDRYEIRGVMGPDEYHDAYPDAEVPGLDNNAYTNVMAAWVFCRALDVVEMLPPHARKEMAELLRLTDEEAKRWDALSRKMYVPFNQDGVISQFEGWEDLKELDWVDLVERYGDIQRLDRILEAEGDSPNRYKASKQADVLMLFYLLPGDELADLFARLGYPFDPASDISRNTEYYLQRTSHGSSLSRVVHSWVLARIDPVRSWEFFLESLGSDLSDAQGGTTAEGIHLGAMAGAVDLLLRGYGGIATHHDMLWVDPFLPPEISRLRFEVHYRGHRVGVDITVDAVRVSTRPGAARPIRVGVVGQVIELGPGEARELHLPRPAVEPAVDTAHVAFGGLRRLRRLRLARRRNRNEVLGKPRGDESGEPTPESR
jgi:alpha,alpha-trehalase